MTHYLLRLSALLLIFVALLGCVEDREVLRVQTYDETELAVLQAELNIGADPISYQMEFPQHMLNRGLQPPPINNQAALLGRVLFYDTRLSKNGTVSCASCHDQQLAFSDKVAFSEGFNGELTKRNSIALAATANFSTSYDGTGTPDNSSVQFFWDERASSIAEQSTMTISDPIEMGKSPLALQEELRDVALYRILNRKAFGTEDIAFFHIVEALEEFCNSLASTGSRFDDQLNWMAQGAPHGKSPFSRQELHGQALFEQHCAGCHSTDMTISVATVGNNGLDSDHTDLGVGGITGKTSDMGVFKIPMLRNIAVTAPYMHDGRFATLSDVIDHYNEGMVHSFTLSALLMAGDGQPKHHFLTDEDKEALVTFLNTLTDETFLQDDRFSDPFKR